MCALSTLAVSQLLNRIPMTPIMNSGVACNQPGFFGNEVLKHYIQPLLIKEFLEVIHLLISLSLPISLLLNFYLCSYPSLLFLSLFLSFPLPLFLSLSFSLSLSLFLLLRDKKKFSIWFWSCPPFVHFSLNRAKPPFPTCIKCESFPVTFSKTTRPISNPFHF